MRLDSIISDYPIKNYLFFNIIILYFLFLSISVCMYGELYSCGKSFKTHIDYIFPARPISCFLYENID